MVDERSYWLDLFTEQTWKECLDAGGTVSGFSEGRWKTVQRIKAGDHLLCHMTGISRLQCANRGLRIEPGCVDKHSINGITGDFSYREIRRCYCLVPTL